MGAPTVLIICSGLFLLPQIRRYAGRSQWIRRHLDSLGWATIIHGVSILLLGILGWTGGVAFGAGVLILIHSYLLADSALDGPAALSLGVGLGEVLLAVECTDSTTALVLLPGQLVAILVTGLLLQPRAQRRQLSTTSRITWVGRETSRRIRARLRMGLQLSLPACLLALLILRVIPQPTWFGWRAPSDRSGQLTDEESTGVSSDGEEIGQSSIFPASLSLESDLDPLGGEVRLEVRLFERDGTPAGRQAGPLLLRGIVLDTFREDDVTLENLNDLSLRRDEDDGREDGWIRLTPGWSNRIVEIQQSDFGLAGRSQDLLFQIEPTRAIEASEVLVHETGFLTSNQTRKGPMTYRLAWQDRNLSASDLSSHRAVLAERRYLQLPNERSVVRSLALKARSITRGANDDYERVRLLTEHFRETFEYSLKGAGFSGVAGVLRFLEKRQGYCTHFAAASVILLRSLGLPARVATGFRTTEWSEESQSHLVRSRDAHAWFEVYFEGVGWVSFDSTAPDRVAEAVQAEQRSEQLARGSWSERLRGELEQWNEAGGSRGSLDGLGRLLLEAPGSALGAIQRAPVVPVVMATLLLGLALFRRFGRRLRRQIPFLVTQEVFAQGEVERLLKVLARRGYPKPSHETLIEYAARLSREPQRPFEGIDRLAVWFSRARFGGRPLQPEERSELEHFLARVARRPGRRPSKI